MEILDTISRWFFKGLLYSFFGAFALALYLDPSQQDHVTLDVGTVVTSYCAHGEYKGKVTHDCSVDVLWDSNKEQRRHNFRFGAQIDDTILMQCRPPNPILDYFKDPDCRNHNREFYKLKSK